MSNLTTADERRFDKLFKQAAKTAMLLWRNGSSDGYQDLANDLWVWYLERPATRRKLSELCDNEIVALLKTIAVQILSGQQHELDLFREKVMYSSENVKDVLKGRSTNKYLAEMLPAAFKKLAASNPQYADAIDSRYNKKNIPPQGPEFVRLTRATKAITEIVNGLCIADTHRDENDNLHVKDGPGSKEGKFLQDREPGNGAGAVAPSSRRKGEHSDPVAAQALALLEHPEIEDELLYLEPITEWTRPPRQVVFLPDGRSYRLSSEEQRRVAVEPAYIEVFIAEVLAR